MARQVLPWVGAAVGFMVGGPVGAQAGFAIGTIVGNAVDPIEMQGRKLGDAPSQVAAEGGARAIVFGKGCIRSTCILERGGRRVIKQRDSSGGKGGSPTTVNERALWTFAIGLGEAIPGGAILRIWEQEKLVYDVTPGSTIPAESAAFAQKFRFYDGSEDQLPDPAIEAIHDDPEDAPYYRGTAYLVFPQYDLTDFGEAVPTYRVEVAAAVLVLTNSWNPDDIGGSSPLLIDQNTTLTAAPGGSGSLDPGARSTVSVTEGLVYFEFLIKRFPEAGSSPPTYASPSVGFGDGSFPFGLEYAGRADYSWGVGYNGELVRNVTHFAPGGIGTQRIGLPYTEGSVVGFLLEPAADRCWMSVDGFWGYQVRNTGEIIATTPGSSNGYLQFPSNSFSLHVPLFATAKVQRWDGDPAQEVTLHAYKEQMIYPIPEGAVALGGSGTVANGQPIPLSSVLSSLHDRCGHTSADYDVSEATDMLAGVVIEQTVTAAEAINSIIGAYFIDPSEYDGKIHYIKRGKPVVRTLTVDDLIDEPETNQRKNAIEYPLKVHFFYQGSAEAYASPKATSSRYSKDLQNVGEVSVSSPVTFDSGQEPAEIAAKTHKVLWAQADGEIVWHVTDEHLDLVPGDCLGLSYRGELVRARITQIEDDPGQRKLKMVRDRQSAYTANITEIPTPPPPTPPQPSIVSPTALAVLDIPALIDSDDDLHLLTAMSGESDTWSGAALQRSTGSGADFETIDSVSNNAIMGLLQEEVAAASPHYPDRTNAVVVELFTSDTIDSLTDEQWLSEGGGFVLSWDDGGVQRWEILQYRDAEPLGGNTYRLTNLMRGRLDTEAAAHPVGAMFVLLDTTLRRHAMQSAWIGTDLTHRAVSIGQSPEDADEQTLTYEGNSQREWPVAHVFFQRDANGVLTATTVPRHRFGTEDNPIRSQNWSGYRWEVTDGTNIITREGTSDSEVFDTLNWGDEITVTVWQLNRITGASDPVSTSGETPAPPTGDVLSLRNVWAYELQMSGVAPYGTAFPTKETPATISETDLLFAFMDSSEEVVPLAGWTLVGEIESDAPSGARRLTVFVKDTVDPATDAGVSFPWETVTDSLANSIGYRAIQTSGASPGTVADVQSVRTTYSVAQTYPHTINFAPVTSGANGGLLLGFALTGWDGNTSAEGLTYPTGHVIVVVRRLNENDTSSQTAQFQAVRIPPPTPTSGTGYYASISVLLEP